MLYQYYTTFIHTEGFYCKHCKYHIATFPVFAGKGRPQVPLSALFQAQVGTLVESATFSKDNFLTESIQSHWQDSNPLQ